jgi:YesN/AraC family two-component response regulator
MPKLTGVAFALKVRGFAPELPFIMVSGYLDPDFALPANVRASLQKPVPVEALLRAVEEASLRR